MNADHLKFIKDVALIGARGIRAHGTECRAIILAFNARPDGNLGDVTAIDIDPADKDTQAALHARFAHMPDIAAAVMIHEAWQAVLVPGEPVPAGRVSERPDRQEVLLVNAMTATEQFVLCAEIHDNRIDDAEFVEVTPQTFTGRFIREPHL